MPTFEFHVFPVEFYDRHYSEFFMLFPMCLSRKQILWVSCIFWLSVESYNMSKFPIGSSHEEIVEKNSWPHAYEMQCEVWNTSLLFSHCIKKKVTFELVLTKISGACRATRQYEYCSQARRGGAAMGYLPLQLTLCYNLFINLKGDQYE